MKRGASLRAAEPMSPVRVPCDVMSNGSCMLATRYGEPLLSACAKRWKAAE